MRIVITGVLSVIQFVGILFLLSPIYLFRWIISKLVRFKPAYGNILSTHSTIFAAPEYYEPNPQFVINVCMEIEGPLNYSRILQLVSNQMVFLRKENGDLVYPELQQYYVTWLGFTFWKWETDFKITDHVFEVQDSQIGERELFRASQAVLSDGFLKEKSPWQVILVEKESSYMLFCKVHHTLGDGHALFKALIQCCDNPTELVKPRLIPESGIVHKLKMSYRILKSGVGLLRKIMFGQLDPNRTTCWDVPFENKTVGRSTSLSARIPILELKKRSRELHISLAALLVAGVCGGIRRFMRLKNHVTLSSLHTSLPVAVMTNEPSGRPH